MQNHKTKTEIISSAICELESPSLAMTKQYLEIHQVTKENNTFKAVSVIYNPEENWAKVYFQIKEEKFYLVVLMNIENKITITQVSTEEWSRVYFHSTSESLSLTELQSMTSLKPTEYFNKGTKRKVANAGVHTFSSFILEPNPGPGDLEEKISKLLTLLEQDTAGIKRMVTDANGYIQIVIEFHNGNGMLGGFGFSQETIKRMSNLNLEFDADLYCSGNQFK